jgi:hypothetical protein
MGRHGTDDAQTGCELSGARDHLANYKANNEITSPDYNAESYAAAATGKTFSEPLYLWYTERSPLLERLTL